MFGAVFRTRMTGLKKFSNVMEKGDTVFDELLKKRAAKEIGVVRTCRDKHAAIRAHYEEEIRTYKAELACLEEKIRRHIDAGERDQAITLASLHKLNTQQLRHSEQMMSVMDGEVQLLDTLLCTLRHLFLGEHYLTIIRAIPERRLPTLMKNPENIRKVHSICTQLLETLLESANRVEFVAREGTEDRTRIEQENETLRRENNLTTEARASDIEDYMVANIVNKLETPSVFGDKDYRSTRSATNRA